MEQNKALEVLIQVSLLAQSKGVLSLDEAVIVKEAIEAFKPVEEPAKEESKDENKK